MSLPRPEQFEEFYRAATLAIAEMELAERRKKEPGYVPEKPPKSKDPFPWQMRLGKRVCAGDWPRAIALPTAAGKTACIDVAVFALACRAREAARRIFFVVDRRIVVDQAFLHANHLAMVLRDAKEGVLKDVADSLREIAQDERPLDVYALRGGMYRETAWIRSPLQPTVIASTVDQVGSRLLFRGYGVSDSMKPIHAGLVGNDALVLLDEAHCAKPFNQTMEVMANYRGKWKESNESVAPFHFVTMTATPPQEIQDAEEKRKLEHPNDLKLIEIDEDDDRADVVLGRRISASKPAELVIAEKATGKNGATELVKMLEKHARELSNEFACVGVIVNRVKTARELKARLGDDAVLLTGRMRPLDRDKLFEEKLKPLLSNAEGSPPRFVVGTQCLECGADFDFHALVTECASLDALRQRFGRLNRVATRQTAKAVVVIRGDQVEPKDKENERDAVYENSLPNTWKWLHDHKDGMSEDDLPWIDFGVSSIRKKWDDTLSKTRTEVTAPSSDAPVLLPAHLDCWVQTNPRPVPDLKPALFLHGPTKPGEPDVQVVFRDDIRSDWSPKEIQRLWNSLNQDAAAVEQKKTVDEMRLEVLRAILALCPPSSSEALPVRISDFKRWLVALPISETSSDVGAEADETVEKSPTGDRLALRWKGPASDETVAISDPNDRRILPGDLFVIPCSALGIETLGDFISELPADYAEEAYLRSRDKAVLRLTDLELSEDDDEFNKKLTDAVQARIEEKFPDWHDKINKNLSAPKLRVSTQHIVGGWVIATKHQLGQFTPDFLEDDESTKSPVQREVKLTDHSRGVAGYAQMFAQGCSLDPKLFFQTGLWHDLGKLDPRFQAMLQLSSPRTAVGAPLAKSARTPRTKEERAEARQVHRYPSGARHELLSAALVATKTGEETQLHLHTTHHGSGRPYAAAVEENDAIRKPFKVELFGETFELPSSAQEIGVWNAELSERFWRVVRKYGWWGAAYSEAIFRLADQAQSRMEQEKPEKLKNTNAMDVKPPPFLPRGIAK